MTFKSFVRHVRLHPCLELGRIIDEEGSESTVEVWAESISGAATIILPVARIAKEKWARLRDSFFNTLVLGDIKYYRHLGLLTDPEEDNGREDSSGLPDITVP